jgi:hypothetical protein
MRFIMKIITLAALLGLFASCSCSSGSFCPGANNVSQSLPINSVSSGVRGISSHVGHDCPDIFHIGTVENDDICDDAEGGSISSLKRKLRKGDTNINSPEFWAIKCEKLTSEMTTEPNLLQVAIWTNNTNLIDAIIDELSGYDDLNIVLVNENHRQETILDWFDRQLAEVRPAMKKRLQRIRNTLKIDFNAKSIDDVKDLQLAGGNVVLTPLNG